MNNVKREIEKIIAIQKQIEKLDVQGIYECYLPLEPATEVQIVEVENYLGFKINAEYRDFLKGANGWKGILQSIDLFGTKEFLGTDEMNHAKMLLDFLIKQGSLEQSGFIPSEIMPIAVNMHSTDLFLITNSDSNKSTNIIWFAGYEIERYDSLREFFESMVRYNEQNLKEFESGLL